MADEPHKLAGCSAKAYDAALHVNLYTQFGDHPVNIIAAVHDQLLGLDRSVCLRQWWHEVTGGVNLCSRHQERTDGCSVCCPDLVALTRAHRIAERDQVIRDVVSVLRRMRGHEPVHTAADTIERQAQARPQVEAEAEPWSRLRAKLVEMRLHDETGDERDAGYMDAIGELESWLDGQA